MNQILEKIEKILIVKFPNKEERDEIIEKSGQVILLETTEKVLASLTNEEERKTFGDLMNNGQVEEAIDFAAKQGIKIEDIFEEVSASVVTELFS
jgi:hypothetical protein